MGIEGSTRDPCRPKKERRTEWIVYLEVCITIVCMITFSFKDSRCTSDIELDILDCSMAY